MNKNNENEWINRFKEDLKKLENVHSIEIPQQSQLMETLNTFKAKRRKAFKRELTVFLITALIIIASYAVIAFKLTTVFVWIQVLALCFIPIIFFAERKRRKKKGEVSDYGF